MNYYPFHIGDFTAHTSHLSWEEDIAYRRMLDAYYLREKPLPVDIDAVARLIRMRESLDAIKCVLGEFFDLRDDGWHQDRCDQEIAGMREKQAESEARDEHERSRMRRHRERRAELFALLRELGVVPAWDVSMKDLQRLCTENGIQPETDLKREQVDNGNAPATAIPTPIPTPIPEEQKPKRAPRFDAQAHLVGLGVDPDIASDWIKLRKAKRAEVTATAIDGVSREAERAGMSVDAALRECCSRGWAGFKADWMHPRAPPAGRVINQTLEERNKAVADAWRPPEMRGAA